MIPAEESASIALLVHHGPAELARPDDQRLFEQPASLQVEQECCYGAIHATTLGRKLIHQVVARSRAMDIPAPVIQLYEAHSGFTQASGQQAVVRKRGCSRFSSVEFQCFGRFLRDVHDTRNGGLHLECKFVLLDPGQDLGITEGIRPASG